MIKRVTIVLLLAKLHRDKAYITKKIVMRSELREIVSGASNYSYICLKYAIYKYQLIESSELKYF